MEILYYIINFLILAGLIFIIGKKTIISIFKTRRLDIENKLNEDLSSKDDTSTDVEPVFVSDPDDQTNLINEEKKLLDQNMELIKYYTDLECRELYIERLNKERNELLKMFRSSASKLYREENYILKENEKITHLAGLILSEIKVTPGDMAYLKHHDVLYVTLKSAYPISKELTERFDKATKELIEGIGGKTSFWVKEDASLIGGISLRIGDTVYDATVEEQIYLFSKKIKKQQITQNDSFEKIVKSFEDSLKENKYRLSVYQLGRVISASDGICWMDGLSDIMYGEVVEFEHGERGMVLDIQKDRIGCVIFNQYEHIESYTKVRRVGRIASVPVGNELLGRVINAIGDPIDRHGHILCTEKRPIECDAPKILDRHSVNRPLFTGIKAIDSMIPIGKGQRELIVGDRQTGKTAIAIDTIINQKGKDVICIYVGIGQKETTISNVRQKLKSNGALDYTVIVSATASESAAMQYIAPFAATAVGEYFMYSGKDVLIVYDDLSKHAVAYRELSLLLQRPSGREAYPGDIFYLHSRLLERSAQLSDASGGGSMTALPIIETQAGDISSYIPTNVISITDGQIFLESELFHSGQRPAVNVGLSVSRVGGSAQTKLMKQMSADIRTKLAQYRELAEFTQFGADVDTETKSSLNTGAHLTEVLKQKCFSPLEDWKQALLLFAVSKGYTDGIELSRMEEFEEYLYGEIEKSYPQIKKFMETGVKADDRMIGEITEAVIKTAERF